MMLSHRHSKPNGCVVLCHVVADVKEREDEQ